ncbi:hypothetical protein [Kitasatospora sp. NPDC088346]|uniref:hypothetical protein n=1 Tax=Kitasatospora sp. NPDC088346 TaxID=3364073 RepID=UPI00382ABFBA
MGKEVEDLKRAYDAALADLTAAQDEANKLTSGGALIAGKDVPGVPSGVAKKVYETLDKAQEAYGKASRAYDAAR